MKKGLWIGVDVGGTFAKLAAMDGKRLLKQGSFPTMPQAGPRGFLERLEGEVRGLAREACLPIGSVVLGIAGDVDSAHGVLRYSPNLKGWENVQLAGPLARRLRAPVRVENDANVAAWGVYVLELRRRARHVLVITMGTGVGGGLVVDGRLHSGADGTAGEIGHTTVHAGGEPCSCGGRGHLEAYAGGRGLVRRFRSFSGPGLDETTPQGLAKLARFKNPHALRVWREAGEALGLAIANAAFLLNLDAVVITGGVSRAGKFFLPALRRALAQGDYRTPFERMRIMLSRRPDSGAMGAALLAAE